MAAAAAYSPRRSAPSPALNHQYSAHTQPYLHSSAFTASRTMRRPSISVSTSVEKPVPAPRKTCACSPTTHPGSFRCSLHKKSNSATVKSETVPSWRLNMRRSAMKNSLVRIGTVEGEWVKRALAALIRPSSLQQRRRAQFQPRPSRFSSSTQIRIANN